jgi:hypothetical protein
MEPGSALEQNRNGYVFEADAITLQNKNRLTTLSPDQNRSGQSSSPSSKIWHISAIIWFIIANHHTSVLRTTGAVTSDRKRSTIEGLS